MAGNIGIREAALQDAYRRAADELDEASGADDATLLDLAAQWRRRALDGWLPADLPRPQAPTGRPGQQMDQDALRREQQIGYALALAACASELHDLAGGEL